MVQLQINANEKSEQGDHKDLTPVEKSGDVWIPAPPPPPEALKPENIITVKSTGQPQCRCRKGKKACICCCTILLFLFIAGLVTMGVLFGMRSHGGEDRRGHCGNRWEEGDMDRYFNEDVYMQGYDVEIIEVPDLSELNYYEVVHDFVSEQTGIINYDDSECYIKPLNTTQVHAPETFWDLISGMSSGEYLVNPDRINEQFDVIYPGIEEYEGESSVITERCEGMTVYMLQKIDYYPMEDVEILEGSWDWSSDTDRDWEWRPFRESQGDSLNDHHIHRPEYKKK